MFRGMFGRKRKESDFKSEIESHIQLETERLVEQGLSPADARAAARRAFGNVTKAQERFYEAGRWLWWDRLWQDIRYGLRQLRRNPGFTTVAIVTLALGIGANTSIFSAVNGILLESLPYPHPSQLVTIAAFVRFPGTGVVGFSGLSSDVWRQVQGHTPGIQETAAYRDRQFTFTGQQAPELVQATEVSGSFFQVMGVPPLLGRPILTPDTAPGENRAAVLSYALWRDFFGGDLSVLGRATTLDGVPYKIIGVMPRGFGYPNVKRGLWVPLVLTPKEATEFGVVSLVARLKEGTTVDGANAELKPEIASLGDELPPLLRKAKLVASGLKGQTVGDERTPLLILLGAVGFVLLIACANVSALLLARGWERHREVAIREALGATRRRMIRQFLVENLLLSLAGGTLGLLVSVWGIQMLRAIAPPGTPRIDHLRLEANVLWFTLAVSLLAGILFGLAPALQASGRGIGAALKEGFGGPAAGRSAGPRSHRLRGSLVIFEVALAVILVIGAALVARSFEKLTSLKLGFRTDHILTVTVNFSKSVCNPAGPANIARCKLALSEVLRRVRSLAGVESAAAASSLPPEAGGLMFSLHVEGRPNKIGLGQGNEIEVRFISPGYFRSSGIPLLRGRSFRDNDTTDSPAVAIVNEAFAETFLGGDPLGKRFGTSAGKNGGPQWRIVGEVGNTLDSSFNRYKPIPEYYRPLGQMNFFTGQNLLVRTGVAPMTVAAAVEQAVWSVDKDAPITDLKTMNRLVAEAVAEPRFRTLLLGAFGALGLLLAVVGVYGVTSHTVGQRTHEIGLRMALGARPSDALRMVIWEGMALAGAGIGIGLCGALALTRLLRGFLFEIKPTDPATFVGVGAALALAALAACYVPARRAARVDPVTALKYE